MRINGEFKDMFWFTANKFSFEIFEPYMCDITYISFNFNFKEFINPKIIWARQ